MIRKLNQPPEELIKLRSKIYYLFDVQLTAENATCKITYKDDVGNDVQIQNDA